LTTAFEKQRKKSVTVDGLDERVKEYRVHVARVLMHQGFPFSSLDEVDETERGKPNSDQWDEYGDVEPTTVSRGDLTVARPSLFRTLLERDELTVTGRVSMSSFIPEVQEVECKTIMSV
jgi:hypothetical protein